MLNRIYIIIGVLAIIVLAGAFIAPRFIQWGDYRDRMQVLASGVLGTPVAIRGEIEFSLLPSPKLHFTDVVVGPTESPAATVGTVDAEFSLMDFLRDNYKVTKLVLDQPVIDLKIDDSGLLASGFDIGEDSQSTSHFALGQASIVNGTVKLADARSGEVFTASGIGGDMKLADIVGPFQFQGNATYDGGKYDVRFNTSAMDGDGSNRLTASIQSEAGMSVSAEGQFTPGIAPRFDGSVSYRQKPPATTVADDIRGDLVLESKVTASTDRIVLSGYTLQPDENRAGTRLTGAASVQLGKQRSFDAVISGGVFGLPPRDASEDPNAQPYEIVRLLGELPAALQPSMPGQIGVDLAEIGLRGLSLRNVRMDAHTDGQTWSVDDFQAKLPGDSIFKLSGKLAQADGRPTFDGTMSLATERLDAIGAIWRKPAEDNPLINLPASYQSKVQLAGDALGLTDGVLTLNGVPHSFGIRVGFGAEKRLDVIGKFNTVSEGDSAALAALVPDTAVGQSFGLSFPSGSFALNGAGATVLGYQGKDLVAEGQWTGNHIDFSRLAATELGGVSFDGAVTASGTLVAPVLWGTGNIGVSSAGAPGLKTLLDALGINPDVRKVVGLSAPADLAFTLSQPDGGGGQTLGLKGKLNSSDADFTIKMAKGLTQLTTADVDVAGTMEAATPDDLTTQLGFGEAHLFPPEGDMFVAINLTGSGAGGFAGRFNASVGEERVGFDGRLNVAANGELQGSGTLDGYLAEASGLAQLIGATGLTLPMLSASAQLHFEGNRLIELSGINGKTGDDGVSGDLSLTRTGDAGVVAGNLAVDSAELSALASVLGGPAALLPVDGSVWPSGPIAMGQAPRNTRGSIAVTLPTITVGGVDKLNGVGFDFVWDDTKTRLSHIVATLGAGQVGGDIAVCCSDALDSKTISGHLTLTNAQLADILPPVPADTLAGAISGGVQFQGTGESVAAALGAMTGEGSFTASALTVKRFDPQVFPAVAKLDNLLNIDADALGALIGISLGQGDFIAPTAEGAVTIAGGIMRLANLSFDGNGGRMAGSINVALGTLGLSGTMTLTPLNFTDPNNLVSADTAKVSENMAGTLIAPQPVLDLDTMVGAVQMRANEIEVAKLEALQVEDQKRQAEAAAERNKLIAEQKARDDAAAAAKAAADAKANPPPAQPDAQTAPTAPTAPMVLTLPPPTNQPTSGTTSTNQPLFTPLN